MAAPATFNPGPSIGPYSLLVPAGLDRSSELYRARDTRVDRTVFIKIIEADSRRREALLDGAPRAASFSNPNVARLLEIGEDDTEEWLYVVSEYVSGPTLQSAMLSRSYSPRRSIGLAIQLAETIADAHAAALIHGDLTPEDIIVTPRGDGKILHLGLATRQTGYRARPADGYASPERMLGDADYPADVFSLGAILFRMLIGRPPSVGPAAADAAEQMNANFHLPGGFGSNVSADLQTTVANALARPVNARCGSAAALAAELRAVAAILDLRGGGRV